MQFPAGDGPFPASFDGADLDGANLTDATGACTVQRHRLTCASADFTDANIMNVDVTGAAMDGVLTGVSSGGVTGTPMALPRHWQLLSGYLVGPGADLSGVGFGGVVLNGLDLKGIDFAGATLTRADLAGTQMKQANLSNAELAGANLADTRFKHAAFTGANLVSGRGESHPPALAEPGVRVSPHRAPTGRL